MSLFRSVAARQAMLAVAPLMAWQVAAKAARDSLFLANFAPTALPAVAGAGALLSILMALLSTRLMVRFGPGRFLPAAFLLGTLLHAVEAVLLPTFPSAVAVLIYLHVSALGSVLISGFWSVAGERFDAREAKRRFGHIAAAGTLASLVGGFLADSVAHWGTASQLLMILALFQFVCAIALARFAASSNADFRSREASGVSLPEVISGAPYLARFAALMLLLAVSASMLDYGFKAQAVAHWGRGVELRSFFALYYAAAAVGTFLVQAGASHLWLRRFGPGRTVAVLPIAVTGATLAAVFVPGALTATLARAVEQILRGSLFRAGYEQLYAPMPQAERRSAKLLIDIGAERTGDGLAAAVLQLLINLPAALAGPVILGIGALCSAVATVFALRMDRCYITMLEKGLTNQAITLGPDESQDHLTRTIVLRTQVSTRATGFGAGTQAAAAEPVSDPVLLQLMELRSGDPARIRHSLWTSDELRPLVVLQVIELLANQDLARDAGSLLRRQATRYTPQLAAALHDTSNPPAVRQRTARILGSSNSRVAFDALFAQLTDKSFEIRYRCANSLQVIAGSHPEFRAVPDQLYDIVKAELPSAGALWRGAQASGGIQDRLVKTNNYLVALLSLVLPVEPIRLAFRALQTADPKLRGIALEYLEGALPKSIASQFAIHLEDVDRPVRTTTSDTLEQLLESSPAIAARLDQPNPPMPIAKR